MCEATSTRGYILAGFSLNPELSLRVDLPLVAWLERHLADWNETTRVAIGNRQTERRDKRVDYPRSGLHDDEDEYY